MPASYSAVPQMDKAVFNGNTGELTCPIVLGNLHNTVLDPYDISWYQIEKGVLPIPVTDQDLLSNDNTVLSIPIDNSTASNVYQCVLHLRRCNIVNNGNNKCQVEEYNGPLMGFAVFGKYIHSILLLCDDRPCHVSRNDSNYFKANASRSALRKYSKFQLCGSWKFPRYYLEI